MIGGIFETIGKTLGVGKEKYFLELDDAAEDTVKGLEKAASKATKAVKNIAGDTAEKAKDAADSAASTVAKGEAKAEKVATTVTQETIEKVQKATQSAQKSAKTAAAKTAVKNQSGSEKATAAPEKATPAAPSTPDPDDIIVNAIAAGSRQRGGKATGPNDELQNFSTEYLMPTKKMRRRRPGPSLSNFKGMAKEVNPRLK